MLAAVRIHAATAAWSPAEVEAAREQGRAITQATFSVLSSNLQQALAHGGVTNALTFCSLQALNLTVLQVNTNLVELRRVSHRPRNLRNAASAEERLVLERFEAELKQRGTVAPVVETNHSDRLIFRGPIVLNNPLCLNCHGRPGAEIQPEHLEVLRRLYPDDQATGFRLGELRGFWSVSFRREALEVSVKPGINAEYLKDDLDPTQWVERFEREGREIYDQRTRIVQSLGLRPGMSVADIGAGTGLFTPALAQGVGPSGTVYAVDIVPKFLEMIAARGRQAGWTNVQTVLCTERSVALPEASIDAAFLCDVYHHFEYPRSSLASIHRALRVDGEVLVVDFRRLPGTSSEWILNHVRAGQEVVEAEFAAAGFRKVEEVPLLKDNYVVRFRRVER